jgi:hypothetical protein
MDRFKRLPRRSSEVWQGGVVRARMWIDEPDGTVRRPWAAVWVSLATGMMNVQLAAADDASDPSLALRVLAELGLKLTRWRPARLEVADGTLGARLAEALADPELSVRVRADLPDVDRVLREMEHGVGGGAPPVPEALDAPGVTVERMRAFAEAARDFYRAAPWVHLSDEDLVHVEAPAVGSGFRFLTVLGAAGQTFGLGFFANPKEFEAAHADPDPQRSWAALASGRCSTAPSTRCRSATPTSGRMAASPWPGRRRTPSRCGTDLAVTFAVRGPISWPT